VDDGPLLADLRSAPERSALFLDVDGVLAPIVPRPEDARVPDETREELRRLAGSYALVACVSGRTSADARRIVGLDELVYVGEHGLELSPDAARWRGALVAFAETVDWPVEDKGLTLSYHYRGVADEAAALAKLEKVAERARAEGLVARFGRKVLELRPPVEAHKGTAVKALLDERGLRRALYAGDDTTDLDGFAALEDGLELGVRVAVSSPEGPRALLEAADLVVEGPPELLELLRLL
jgi:trehalose 6-phosphate phosphatase